AYKSDGKEGGDNGEGDESKGFTPEEKKELGEAINKLQTALESKQKAQVETVLKAEMKTINESIEKFGDWKTKKDEEDVKNQKALDEVLAKFKDMQDHASLGRVQAKSLQAALIEALADPDNLKG